MTEQLGVQINDRSADSSNSTTIGTEPPDGETKLSMATLLPRHRASLKGRGQGDGAHGVGGCAAGIRARGRRRAPPAIPAIASPAVTGRGARQRLLAEYAAHGRPGTPTDQAHIESSFSHLKANWPHLTQIRDPAVLDTELARVRIEYNTVGLHAGIGYVTPDDEHHGRSPAIRRARAAGLKRAHQERVEHNHKHRPGSTR